jgi:endonuclease/exonuclease/phosphatase family metal-dependent hydrolase
MKNQMIKLFVPLKESKILSLVRFKMYKFSDNGWSKSDFSDSSISLKGLKIASYNVLHDLDRNHIMLPNERYSHQMELFQSENFDIIGLCEVTQTYLNILKENKFIQQNYFISRVSSEGFHEHGEVLISKFPFSSLKEIKIESLKRPIVIGSLQFHKFTLDICVAHLVAYQQNYEKRKFQLERIYEILKDSEASIIMGDLNFHQPFEDEYIGEEFLDSWSEIHGEDEDGFTYDPEVNVMIYEKLPIAFEYRQMRLDRILFKGNHLTPKSMKIFGNHPLHKFKDNSSQIDYLYYLRWPLRSMTSALVDWTFYMNLWRNPKEYLFPSDHFGLTTTFELFD